MTFPLRFYYKMSTKAKFQEVRELLDLNQAEMAKRLGISRPYLSAIENERRFPSEGLIQNLAHLKEAFEVTQNPEARPKRQAVGQGVPVISWARAGTASSYEAMPFDWQEVIPTDCPDEDAFGLILEGDSMEPKFVSGDIVVVMPQRQPRSNLLVAAKIRGYGVVFKMLNILASPRRFQLISYNASMYAPLVHPEADFEWIYPAYEVRRRLWH